MNRSIKKLIKEYHKLTSGSTVSSYNYFYASDIIQLHEIAEESCTDGRADKDFSLVLAHNALIAGWAIGYRAGKRSAKVK